MIGSLTEAWQQMADLARRREAIAEQGPVPAAGAAPAHQPGITSLMPGPLAGPAPMALKAAEPDVAKRKSGGGKRRPGKDGKPDLTQEQVATAAHDMAEGAANAEGARSAGKSYVERGAQEGPADSVHPGRVEPDDIGRPYLADGHAAPSPGHEPPRTNPVPAPYGRGVPTPIELTPAPAAAGHAGPLTAAIAAHEARATLRPPIPGGAAR